MTSPWSSPWRLATRATAPRSPERAGWKGCVYGLERHLPVGQDVKGMKGELKGKGKEKGKARSVVVLSEMAWDGRSGASS